MNLPESQANFEAPSVEGVANPAVVIPESTHSSEAHETEVKPVATQPVVVSKASGINLPNIEAVASGAQTADAETTQAAMENIFESNADNAV